MSGLESEVVATHTEFRRSAQARIMPTETVCLSCDIPMLCVYFEKDGRVLTFERCPRCKREMSYFKAPPKGISAMEMVRALCEKGYR